MDRYSVVSSRYAPGRWFVFDHALSGFCALPDEERTPAPNLLPLEWSSKAAAEAHLNHCYRTWRKRPRLGERHPANFAHVGSARTTQALDWLRSQRRPPAPQSGA